MLRAARVLSPMRSSEKRSSPSSVTGWIEVVSSRLSRARRAVGRMRAKSGTCSMSVEEFSRPYQRAGEPHRRLTAYFTAMIRWSPRLMSVSGTRVLRIMQKRKSPTAPRVR